jgi:hypothetical protein
VRNRRAEHSEARAGQRLEQRRERGIAHLVVRPGNASAQHQHGIGKDRPSPGEALASGIGRIARLEAESPARNRCTA